MTECDHDFDIIEEDVQDDNYTILRPTRCSKCDACWDWWVYRWDGSYQIDDAGKADCDHEWEAGEWDNSSGRDGAPVGTEYCRHCGAKRSFSFTLADSYYGDGRGNRL